MPAFRSSKKLVAERFHVRAQDFDIPRKVVSTQDQTLDTFSYIPNMTSMALDSTCISCISYETGACVGWRERGKLSVVESISERLSLVKLETPSIMLTYP